MIMLLKHQQDDSLSITEEVPGSISKNREFFPKQLMLLSKEKERNLGLATSLPHITSLTNSFDLKNYQIVDCAFHYWAEQDSKVLSRLTWTVLALFMIRVSVKRLFSGVKLKLSDFCNSLAEDTLPAIMS